MSGMPTEMPMPMSPRAWAAGASIIIGAAMRLATSNVVTMRFTVALLIGPEWPDH
jgi:hypothetical protein